MYREIGKYIIRDWQMEDAPSIAKYANNRKIWMHLRDTFPHPYGLQDAETFISRVIEANPKTVFAIATQSEAIGSIGHGRNGILACRAVLGKRYNDSCR